MHNYEWFGSSFAFNPKERIFVVGSPGYRIYGPQSMSNGRINGFKIDFINPRKISAAFSIFSDINYGQFGSNLVFANVAGHGNLYISSPTETVNESGRTLNPIEIITGVEPGYQAGRIRVITNLTSLHGNYLLSENISKIFYEGASNYGHFGTVKMDTKTIGVFISEKFARDGSGRLYYLPLERQASSKINDYTCWEAEQGEIMGQDFISFDLNNDSIMDQVVSSRNSGSGKWSMGVGSGLVRIIWGK